MILLLYNTAADPAAYEPWLRAVDNPFFNAIPGIKRYENWKITSGGEGLPFSHFDYLELGGPGDLERVWYNPSLDDFRKGWIAKWGYSKPNMINAFGYRMERVGAARAIVGQVMKVGLDAGTGEEWAVRDAVRKHYAIGPAPAGESWITPIPPHSGPGFSRWRVDGPGSANRLTVELIAAPA